MPSEVYIFSSDERNGATNISPDGSQFSIQFTNPLFLPSNAYNAKLEVIQADIWNVSPNVSEALDNNTFTIKDENGIHTVVLDDGLYDVDTVYNSLALKFDNLTVNRPSFPFKDYFSFEGNEATNRMYIVFKAVASSHVDVEILWAESTLRLLMGFHEDSPTQPFSSSDTHDHSLIAPNAAKFNAYNSFVIHSDIVNTGIQLNNNFDNIIGQIQITKDPGELESFRATQPNIFALCNNLIGTQNGRYQATFTLTSETGINLDMRGEAWTIICLFSWLEHDD